MVKGMLKRALSLFLTLFLVIGFLPAATVSAATETVGGMLADPFIGLSSTGDSSGSWTAGGTEIKGEVTGSNKTSCAPAKSAETTLTITNSKSVKASIFSLTLLSLMEAVLRSTEPLRRRRDSLKKKWMPAIA